MNFAGPPTALQWMPYPVNSGFDPNAPFQTVQAFQLHLVEDLVLVGHGGKEGVPAISNAPFPQVFVGPRLSALELANGSTISGIDFDLYGAPPTSFPVWGGVGTFAPSKGPPNFSAPRAWGLDYWSYPDQGVGPVTELASPTYQRRYLLDVFWQELATLGAVEMPDDPTLQFLISDFDVDYSLEEGLGTGPGGPAGNSRQYLAGWTRATLEPVQPIRLALQRNAFNGHVQKYHQITGQDGGVKYTGPGLVSVAQTVPSLPGVRKVFWLPGGVTHSTPLPTQRRTAYVYDFNLDFIAKTLLEMPFIHESATPGQTLVRGSYTAMRAVTHRILLLAADYRIVTSVQPFILTKRSALVLVDSVNGNVLDVVRVPGRLVSIDIPRRPPLDGAVVTAVFAVDWFTDGYSPSPEGTQWPLYTIDLAP